MRHQAWPWLLALVALVVILVRLSYATGCGATYTVQPGDNLDHIARQCQVSVYDLIQLNDLAQPDVLQIGQTLILLGPNTVPGIGPKGLAMAEPRFGEDLVTLDVDWHYVWGWCAEAACFPMVRAMEPPPICPPVLLVGNEPNAVEPFGAPLSPEAAVPRLLAIEQQCPQTRLIVGNVSADDWSTANGWGSGQKWLGQFLREYHAVSGDAFGQTLGVHCYTRRDASYCIARLEELRAEYSGAMWVTEFGLLDCEPREYARLLGYVSANFSYYAAFTNRQPHTGEGWELSRTVELVNDDGTLNECGAVYATH